ncbi:MAG: NAD(P)/FAD-dependent oxidoreductase [Dehalococcoidia bacterium]|nr:NAD(P)/FAD-dependent oxidoreductase [Dehalococcoidia bacterium]
MVKKEFDVVVVGAGITGIAAGAYLQKAGLDVAVVERLGEAGPGCMTVETLEPGAAINTHIVMGLTGMGPCVEDLDLERFGLKMVYAPTQYGATYKDGKNVMVYHDPQKTAASIARHSEKDAQRYTRIINNILPEAVDLYKLVMYSPPTPDNLGRIWESLARYLDMTPQDIVTMNGFEMLDLLFESERVKQTFMGVASIGFGGDPIGRGEGILNNFAIMWLPQGLFKGGSHNLVHALVRCFTHHGGTMIYNSPVEQIVVENGTARGVMISEDSPYPEKEIRARKAVLSNLSAPLSLQVIGEDKVKAADPVLARRMKDWNMSGESPFMSVWLLKDLPRWKSDSWDPAIRECWEPYRCWDSWEEAKQWFTLFESEELWRTVGTVGEIFLTAAADKTQLSPEGHCVLVYEEELPVHLRREGGFEKWDDIKWKVYEQHTEMMEELAPGMKKLILASQVHTPLDNWRKNPSAIYGHEYGGDCKGDQWYLGRLAYRMPIGNLYQINSCWPIGASFLGSAYVAAGIVAEDLGVRNQPWWNHPPLVWYLKQVGLA